jgi:hypothetical protein
MPFSLEEWLDLVRLLEQHPEWRAELRRLVLTEEVLSLPRTVSELAEAQRRTEQRLEELVEAQRHTEQRLQELAVAQRRSDHHLGRLLGLELERRCREKAPSYFQNILRRIRLLEQQALGLMLDDAVDSGVITPEEKAEALLLDLVVRGHRNTEDVYLAVEVSSTVDRDDVQRAAFRAELLEKAAGKPVLAAVAGERLSGPAAEEAAARGVTYVLDGRVLS